MMAAPRKRRQQGGRVSDHHCDLVAPALHCLHRPVPSYRKLDCMAASQGFVRVSTDRTRFEEGPPGASRPFFFAGANCYYLLVSSSQCGCEQPWRPLAKGGRRRHRYRRRYHQCSCCRQDAPPGCLQTRAADAGLRHECTAVLDDAAAAGITVIRTWAFADGPDLWNALQVAAFCRAWRPSTLQVGNSSTLPAHICLLPHTVSAAAAGTFPCCSAAPASLTSECSEAWTGCWPRRRLAACACCWC